MDTPKTNVWKTDVADKINNAPAEMPEPIFIENQNPQVAKLQTAIDLMNQARAHHKQGEFSECFDAMSKAEETAPWYWEIYLTRAKMVDKWFEGALADIDEAIRRQPGHEEYVKERSSIIRKAQLAGVVNSGN